MQFYNSGLLCKNKRNIAFFRVPNANDEWRNNWRKNIANVVT